MGSLVLLIGGVVLAYFAAKLGIRVAWMFAHSDGYTPMLLAAGTFLAFVGLVICEPLSLFRSALSKSPIGRLGIAACAAICAIVAAYMFGLTKFGMPVDLYGGTNLWNAVLLLGLVPVMAVSWSIVSRR